MEVGGSVTGACVWELVCSEEWVCSAPPCCRACCRPVDAVVGSAAAAGAPASCGGGARGVHAALCCAALCEGAGWGAAGAGRG
jgi:hypothetical protein